MATIKAQLEIIEQQLGIHLPSHYKKAMENYPFTPIDNLDFVEDNLVKDFEWLVRENTDLIKFGFFGNSWPRHLFAIGHDGFGNYIFINLESDDEEVFIADHEVEFDPKALHEMLLASNFKEYINSCIEQQIDVVKNA